VKTETEFDWNRTFTGQVWDSETGLMLYRNRYYDVEFGRFISMDPIGYNAGDINLFRMIFNRILNGTDYWGLQFQYEGLGCFGVDPYNCQENAYLAACQNLPPPIPPQPPQDQATNGYICCKEYKFEYQMRGFKTPKECVDAMMDKWYLNGITGSGITIAGTIAGTFCEAGGKGGLYAGWGYAWFYLGYAGQAAAECVRKRCSVATAPTWKLENCKWKRDCPHGYDLIKY
jgi:RHS repeat-associated protein